MRSLSSSQKEKLQRSATVEKKRPVESESAPNNSGFEYVPGPDRITTSRAPDPANTQRRSSTQDKTQVPLATGALAAIGVNRRGSNKLKKEPPGDPWYNRRTEAERQYQDVQQRGHSVDDQPWIGNSNHRTAREVGPSRETAFRSHPQNYAEKELPPSPGYQGLRQPEDVDSASEEEIYPERPVRRGTLSKIERLTGQRNAADTQSPDQYEEDKDVKPSRRASLTSKLQRLTGTGPRP